MTFNDLDALTCTLFESLTPKSLAVVEHPNYENREIVSLIPDEVLSFFRVSPIYSSELAIRRS